MARNLTEADRSAGGTTPADAIPRGILIVLLAVAAWAGTILIAAATWQFLAKMLLQF